MCVDAKIWGMVNVRGQAKIFDKCEARSILRPGQARPMGQGKARPGFRVYPQITSLLNEELTEGEYTV